MCYCLQICNSVVNIVVMVLVLEQSFMVISSTVVLKVSPLYNVFLECLCCCCLQINYIFYNRSLQVVSLDPTCLQNFRSLPLMIFEILRLYTNASGYTL